MPIIPLDRRFLEWTQASQADAEAWWPEGRAGGSLGWDEVLASRRAVILAEGGSGKSSEFAERHRLLNAEGKFSFYLTVKKAGQKGVAESFTSSQARKFEEWRASDQPAWFFVDSVDEAKAAGVGLAEALESVAEAIEGAELRAHVVLSGRPSDWEFRKDLDSLIELLTPPSPPPEPEAVDMDELVVKAIRRQPRESKPPPPKPLVALMAPLDNDQVEQFARAKQIKDVARFLEGLAESNLWSFARRPLDLDWLARYWLGHGSFASFEAMLEANLVERLTEANPERARTVQLDQAFAMQALERIGAALVLGKLRDVEIPDSANRSTPSNALRLRDALPDMSLSMQTDLINAAVLVPSGAGLVRLHNDNDGVVRSYLAARWLNRMLLAHCPWSAAKDLLFADTYGVASVKPSMVLVAAWLSLWDHRAADELARRQPLALVEHGDPSSLPLPVRRKALRGVMDGLAAEDAIPLLNHDGLKRFARADLESDIKELWESFKGSEAPRQLLLQVIAQGRLRSCAPIAFEAGIASGADTLTRALAAQAIARAGDGAMRARYADFLRREASALDAGFLWNAIELLFPVAVTVDDFLQMLPKLLAEGPADGLGIDFYGPRLVKRIDRLDDAARLLDALLGKLPQTAEAISDVDLESISPLLPTVAGLANRILDLDASQAPPNLAIDASLRLTAVSWMHGRRVESMQHLAERLRETPQRRRATLWRFAQTYDVIGQTPGEPLSDPWQLNAVRFEHGAGLDDVEWLLGDARSRGDSNERLLALRLAMSVWRDCGMPDSLLRDAIATAGDSTELKAAIDFWISPPPRPVQWLRMDEEHAKHQAAERERQAARDASWVSFAAPIRDNPAQLDSLRPPDSEGIDARIYHIWQLLDGLSDNSRGRSMSDVNLLTPLFGADAVAYIRRAFIRYWRFGTPRLRCERPAEQANTDNAMERVGLVGISIEAASDPNWARGLKDEEAQLAASYATLELNGFPKWFEQLAASKPDPVRALLRQALAPELAAGFSGARRESLDRIASSSDAIVALVADNMFDLVTSSPAGPVELLSSALRIARRGGRREPELLNLSLARAREASEPRRIAMYLACAFAIDGDETACALFEIGQKVQPQALTELASILLPSVVGDAWSLDSSANSSPVMSTENLAKLIRFAFEAVRPEEDNNRSNGKAYSPDLRDHAESARNLSMKRLADRPGAASFKALLQLADIRGFPVPKRWLIRLAHNRAEQDSESGPWMPPDVKGFEEDFDTVPRTPADLQRVAAARIEDLQHRLIHSDYGQGDQLARLEHEVDVQRWMADALQAKQGRSFTLEREPHVAEEKEPDIRLSSKGSGARLPIEIKVAESWSLRELEEALTVQLMGRYLRDRNARWGILLLVHQKPRLHGWKTVSGKFLSFEETLAHLQEMAARISASDSVGPQMQVGAIDVSSVHP